MGYVKNVTAHYRQLLDEVLNEHPELHTASSGKTRLLFAPNPDKTFHRGTTDYFSQGRKADIGAFDTPAFVGLELGQTVTKGRRQVVRDGSKRRYGQQRQVNYPHKREVIGLQANVVERKGKVWRVYPNSRSMRCLVCAGIAVSRNRDHVGGHHSPKNLPNVTLE